MNLKEIIIEELHKLQQAEKALARGIIANLFNVKETAIEAEQKARQKQEEFYNEVADNIISKMDWQVIGSGEVYPNDIEVPFFRELESSIREYCRKNSIYKAEIAIRVKEE